jgi:hypothetical protein
VTFAATVTSAGAIPAALQWQWDYTTDGTYAIMIPSAENPNARTTADGSTAAKTVRVRAFDALTGREAMSTLTVTVS